MRQSRYELPLRWGDMDAMQHLNNVQYFRLFEEARIRWFVEQGLPALPVGQAPILAHVSCDFVKAMVYPATAVVFQSVEKLGTSSVTMDLRIERLDEPGVVHAKGRSVIVWYDYDAGCSRPWPQAVRDRLA